MDIAAASISMSSAQVQYSASIAMLKNVMEAEEAVAQAWMACMGDLPVASGSETIDIYI